MTQIRLEGLISVRPHAGHP